MVGEDLPMIRRIPKRGFFNSYAVTVVSLNIGDICQAYQAGEEVTVQSLQDKGLLKKRFDQVKILAGGDVDKALKVSAHRFSEGAQQKIEAAGGSVIKIKPKLTPRERVAQRRQGQAKA